MFYVITMKTFPLTQSQSEADSPFRALRRRVLRGFSLVEVLIVIAVVSCVAAAAIVLLSNVQNSAANANFHSQVHELNRAVKTFQVHGGKIWSSQRVAISGLHGD